MLVAEKKPAVRWKRYQTKPPTERTVRDWFGGDSTFGITVIFGKASGGLVSRDFDIMVAYEDWALSHPQLAASLPTVETRRGRHVYCRANEKHISEVRSRLGKPDGTGAITFPNGELRAGVGCYSVVPPSQHPSGTTYRWLNPPSDFRIVNLVESGLVMSPDDTERTEKTESTEEYRGILRSTEAIGVKGGEFFGDLPWDSNIQRDVLETLPTRSGMRNNNVFELARTLKAIPTLADAPGKHLRPYVRFWHEQALPVIGTKAFEETWIDFLKGWSRVKFPKGSGPMSGILSRALEAELPKEAIVYEQEPLQLLVSLCRELQRVHGDSPFFLSCRKAGQLLHVPFKTENRWLFLLVQDGVLDLVIQGSMSGHQASRFRYTGAT